MVAINRTVNGFCKDVNFSSELSDFLSQLLHVVSQLSDVITIRDVFDFKRCKDGSPKLPGASKDNVRILTIIPARGGSKGIPHKNIYPICGKPLLAYTIEVLQASAVSDALVVSTDDGKIKKVAEAYPGVMVIDRPGEIAGDDVSTEAALLHAVDYMHKQYQQDFDCIVTAQPTSPLRVPETVRRFVEEYVRESDKYDAQLTLTANYSDFWLRDLNGDFRRRSLSIPRLRQAREPLYTENSCLYITSIDALIETHSVLGTRCNGFVISEREAVDINTMHDIRIAQAYLEESGGYVTQ